MTRLSLALSLIRLSAKDQELAAEFNVCQSGMYNRLARLMAAGRVTRQRRTSDSVEGVQRCRYGGMKRAARAGSGRWVYMLCDRRAA